MRARRFYEFGVYRLDPTERLLLKGSSPISLTPKAFDLLLLMVQNSGHLLEKETLLDTLWGETFVEEGTVAQHVFLLRKTLGDGPAGHPFIETVPKKGYRFAAPVVEVQESIDAGRLPLTDGATRKKQGTRRAAVALLALLALAVTVYWMRHEGAMECGETPERVMLAVLPFENLSTDAEEHICDGLTEEMITQLGSLAPERLGVIARTSAMLYKGADKGVDLIGEEARCGLCS